MSAACRTERYIRSLTDPADFSQPFFSGHLSPQHLSIPRSERKVNPSLDHGVRGGVAGLTRYDMMQRDKDGKSMIDHSARIHSSASVAAEATIGARTTVWQSAVVLSGASIGSDCNLNAHTLVEGGAVVGDRVTLKCGVYVWSGITLEDDVFCGPNATFTNDRRPRSKVYPDEFAQTLVKRGASIGAGAVLLPGITIGEGAMIGAGAVVTKDVPAGETWIGNPARKMKGEP